MAYVDGFVCAVATANKEQYLTHAKLIASVFKEHGALQVVECWGDDVPDGKVTSFPLAVQRKEDETVVFSWVRWPSRTIRDQAWGKVMQDPRLSDQDRILPFDGQRLIYGGFEMLLEIE
ncbi:DUF1428 domain-containing protein [Undibacterium fentianense]|uniref:DUF1428 domain-containing protein n=1 Tax=Undibacterium fentianense TaxID=2828728 RepID=A0A941IFQ0_9BURK|nr:DUF1428 domain-containing protein [Undibacterium fentianense]MBR7799245.1 DUF1428 domain-containing protein [Undibacterium fentianense]